MKYNIEEETLLKELETNPSGLTTTESKKRLKKYGPNKLPSKPRKKISTIFFEQLLDPIEIILLITVVISFLIGETIDALVITFIILIDVLMGTYQENKALKSLEALTNMIKVTAKVLRDGVEQEIAAENIVVGDILLLDSGTKISADARIIESRNLQVNESVLTGESTATFKETCVLKENTILAERKNMVYAGTNVMTGRAKACVIATAIHTEIGKIASKVSETKEEKSPLTIRMEKFSKQISILILIVALISMAVLYLNNYPTREIFLSVVALAVSAMPEGLPLALTMALTIASNRMSQKNVIVKKLNSVESLGSCTVIASDKTGTLTVNEQTAKKIVLADNTTYEVSGSGYSTDGSITSNKTPIQDELIRLVNLCALNNEANYEVRNNKPIYNGDSIDIAFLVLHQKLNENLTWQKKDSIPYESENQYSAVFYQEEGKLRCTVKGSLEKVMIFSENKETYQKQNELLSKEGYRVIAVCDGEVAGTNPEDIHNLTFLGLVAFIDPIREEALNSIESCNKAGIKVVMITGDHPLTATKIAKDLNLIMKDSEVTTGSELEKYYEQGQETFDQFIQDKKVFSRVTPLDKLHIVESYKRMGEFVAVTGDGVNDAPAIKDANIGIAMGSGTDVAKDTASMIITDDNFTSIVSGIEEGRIAYANIRKITLFLLSCGMAEVLFFLLAISLGYDIPLLAIQLLWINVVTDGLQDISLSFERSKKQIMEEKPRSTKESLFNKDLIIEVLVFGATISTIVITTWKYLIDRNTNLLLARSMIMMLMVFIQNIHVLNCRSEKNSIFQTSLFTNPLVIGTIISSIILQLIVTEIPFLAKFLSVTPLKPETLLGLFCLAFMIVVVAEIYKWTYRKVKKQIE
ncbi:MAG: HAD-IC family P-type ATPase [bacterium]|nr:HAD-IC family P-type ATPase [bacterium]